MLTKLDGNSNEGEYGCDETFIVLKWRITYIDHLTLKSQFKVKQSVNIISVYSILATPPRPIIMQ